MLSSTDFSGSDRPAAPPLARQHPLAACLRHKVSDLTRSRLQAGPGVIRQDKFNCWAVQPSRLEEPSLLHRPTDTP
jgi:hypothetical protein